jgi:hypothetical protein
MKCTICSKEVVLIPSARERAAKHGGKPADYTKLFTTHAECAIAKYNDETLALMRQIRQQHEESRVILSTATGRN